MVACFSRTKGVSPKYSSRRNRYWKVPWSSKQNKSTTHRRTRRAWSYSAPRYFVQADQLKTCRREREKTVHSLWNLQKLESDWRPKAAWHSRTWWPGQGLLRRASLNCYESENNLASLRSFCLLWSTQVLDFRYHYRWKATRWAFLKALTESEKCWRQGQLSLVYSNWYCWQISLPWHKVH